MRPLPVPEKGGSIDDLRQFLNLRDDNDFVLIVAWLLAAFRPQGPYAVLAVSGGQGSAKSSLSKLVRSLVDPNVSPVRSIPSKVHDIFIAAKSGHVVPFDNISSLSNWISDALCQLATGAGYVARQLRTDSDQVFFEASRPIILNGIGGFIDRSDLADRTIFVSLPPISSYRPEDELRREFDAAQPRILGALLDAVAYGLRTLPTVCPDNRWRMADFAKFATACEGAFRTPGTFAAAYSNNREQAIGEMLDADPIADAVVELMKATAKWQGTAAQLLEALAKVAGSGARERGWPKIPGHAISPPHSFGAAFARPRYRGNARSIWPEGRPAHFAHQTRTRIVTSPGQTSVSIVSIVSSISATAYSVGSYGADGCRRCRRCRRCRHADADDADDADDAGGMSCLTH